MKKTIPQIEAWALRVHDHVTSGRQNEDSLVELKSEWPTDFCKTARRIAGHANAARGEPILWIIGLAPEGKVVGANESDLAQWWPQVCAKFDGPTPRLQDVIVYTTPPLVALYFEVDQPPYLVKSPPEFGNTVVREVPWREGTSIRTAKHADLISLLVPQARSPIIEPIEGILRCAVDERRGSTGNIWVRVLVIPIEQSPVVVRSRDCIFEISDPVSGQRTTLEATSFVLPSTDEVSVRTRRHHATVLSPAEVRIQSDFGGAFWTPIKRDFMNAMLEIKTMRSDISQVFPLKFVSYRANHKSETIWRLTRE